MYHPLHWKFGRFNWSIERIFQSAHVRIGWKLRAQRAQAQNGGINLGFQRREIGTPDALRPCQLMDTNSMIGRSIDVNAATYPLRGTENLIYIQPAVRRESAATAG